jgi:hypothetical protein
VFGFFAESSGLDGSKVDMKKLIAAGCAACAIWSFILAEARAAEILYEPFNYSNVGGPVSDNTPANWAFGGTGANDLSVVSGNLSYSGLPSLGNSGTNGGAGLGVRRLFGTTTTSGDLYFSALFNLTSYGTAWTSPAAGTSIGALTDTDNTGFKLNVLVVKDTGGSGGYFFGIQKGGTGSTFVFDTTPHLQGETVLLVGRYSYDPAAADVISLWISPDSSTFGQASPTTSPTLTANTGTDSIGIDRFNIRQNTAASVPDAMQWDELRVGTTWGDVTPVPEPSAWALLGLGTAVLLARRFRSRN